MKWILLFFMIPVIVSAQPVISNYPSLSIQGSARGWGMGGTGIASGTTNQSLSSNVAKTAFSQYFHQSTASYIPWMRTVTDDAKFMRLDYAASLHNNSAFGMSFTFLDLGSVPIRNEYGAMLGYYHANEFNLGGSYAIQLGGNVSLGTTIRFIGSRYMEEAFVNKYNLCGDLGYYQYATIADNAKLEWGVVMSNLGPAINLSSTAGIGIGYSFHDEQNNQFSFEVDGSKLLSANQYKINAGAEWGYDEQFFLRGGASIESANAGNRKFLSLGCGYKGFVNDQSWAVDLFYLIPFGTKAVQSPFQNTLGLTLSLNIGNFQ